MFGFLDARASLRILLLALQLTSIASTPSAKKLILHRIINGILLINLKLKI